MPSLTQLREAAVKCPVANQQVKSARLDPLERAAVKRPAMNQQVKSAKLDPVEESSSADACRESTSAEACRGGTFSTQMQMERNTSRSRETSLTQWSRTAVRRPAVNQQITSAKPDPIEENSSDVPSSEPVGQ